MPTIEDFQAAASAVKIATDQLNADLLSASQAYRVHLTELDDPQDWLGEVDFLFQATQSTLAVSYLPAADEPDDNFALGLNNTLTASVDALKAAISAAEALEIDVQVELSQVVRVPFLSLNLVRPPTELFNKLPQGEVTFTRTDHVSGLDADRSRICQPVVMGGLLWWRFATEPGDKKPGDGDVRRARWDANESDGRYPSDHTQIREGRVRFRLGDGMVPQGTDDYWRNLFEIHGAKNPAHPGEAEGSGPGKLMIEWLEGSVYLLWRKQKIIEDASGAAIGTTAGNASAPGGYQLALPYSVGDEFELTFEYRVSDRAGFLKAWIDGQLVVDDDTGQFGYGLERETYLQAGVYAKEDGVTPITNFVHFPVEFSSRTADPSVYDSDAAPFRYDANHGSYMSAWNSDPQTDDFSLAASFYPDNFLTGPVTIDAVWSSSSSVEIIGYAQAFVFGNYPTDLGSTLPAVPVSRLKSCQVSIDWDLAEEAPVSNLVVLLEAFLTQTADATSTKVYEAAVWAALDTDGIYYHNNIATDAIGTFTDNLLDWVVRSARNKGFGGTIDYTIAIPDDGNPRKSLNFDFAAYLQWLVTQGELTGSEFFHGISFGPEFRKQLDLPQFVRGAASVEVDFDTGLISNGYFVRSLANVWAQGSERFYLHDGYCQVKGAPALAPLAQDPAFFTAPIGPGTIEVDWEILRNADPADTIRIKFRDEDGDHVGTTRSTVGQYTETIVLDKVATKFDVQAMTDDQDIDFIITDVRQVA